MANISSIKLPKINTQEISNDKYAKKISNYLLMLEENLRYMFENLDDDNLTDHFIENLTVGHLLITNEANSIIANPDVGLQMLKGEKKQFYFDLNTGEAFFGGSIVGGSIESDNYEAEIAGMRVDLINGTIDSPKTKWLSDGTIQSNKFISEWYDGLATRTTLIENGYIDTDLIEAQMAKVHTLEPIYIKLPIDGSGMVEMNYGKIIECQELNGGTPTTSLNFKSQFLTTLGGSNGSFTTADGKTITVSDGIITGIV